jgi:hypothetical protein
MSHHASGPDFGFPRGDARLDKTDLYAFPQAVKTHNSVSYSPGVERLG